MITKTFYLGGNNNHVDGSFPTRQEEEASFGILSFGKTLKLSSQRLTGCETMSRSSDTSPPIVKRERVSKNVLVLHLYPAFQTEVPETRMPQGRNTNKTLHSRCQSASRGGVNPHEIRQEKVNRTVPVFTTAIYSGDGGDRRDRTDDLKLAKLPLYQLSYVPSSLSSQAKRAVPRRNHGGPGKT